MADPPEIVRFMKEAINQSMTISNSGFAFITIDVEEYIDQLSPIEEYLNGTLNIRVPKSTGQVKQFVDQIKSWSNQKIKDIYDGEGLEFNDAMFNEVIFFGTLITMLRFVKMLTFHYIEMPIQ